MPGIVCLLVLLPHLVWLVENDYITINYALFRSVGNPLTGFEGPKFLNHIFYPLIFLGKQIGILLPFFIMLFFCGPSRPLARPLSPKKNRIW